MHHILVPTLLSYYVYITCHIPRDTVTCSSITVPGGIVACRRELIRVPPGYTQVVYPSGIVQTIPLGYAQVVLFLTLQTRVPPGYTQVVYPSGTVVIPSSASHLILSTPYLHFIGKCNLKILSGECLIVSPLRFPRASNFLISFVY